MSQPSPSELTHPQDTAHALSLSDPDTFWAHHASQVSWHKPPTSILQRSTKTLKDGKTTHPHWKWFAGGELNTCYNCVDRHVKAGNGDREAIIWDSAVTGRVERYTYGELLREVETLAGCLREEGLKKGDVVVVYMPMIPAALIALLAITRLGAIHAVVFGGFSAPSLAQRIDSSKPRMILTASCGIEGGKGPIPYKPMIEGAVGKSSHKVEKVLVWQREESKWEGLSDGRGMGLRDWRRLVRSAKQRGVKAECVPVRSEDPSYIIYTSGTTGSPKGVVRDTAGHLVGLNFTVRYIFSLRGPGDVMFCASDIGWVVGHSYILYGPLLAGSTTILFEGKPIGTPNAGTFWRLLKTYKANVMFTAPTALRAIRREDPESKYFKEAARDGGLKGLRALFLAGERSEPSIVSLYQRLLGEYCEEGAQVIDNWWSSESGSPMTALSLLPGTATHFASPESLDLTAIKPLRMKPGSAGKPMPGFDIRVVDDEGNEVPRGNMGNIVLGTPLAPTAFTTLWQDEDRFYKGYLKRFEGKWLDTGDSGFIDSSGYVNVMSRSDDIINVAAHRFSTGAIEQAITSHPLVAEACVVGIPDALKGNLPFAFATLSTDPHPSSVIPAPEVFREIQKLVRDQIGAIASLGGMIIGKGIIPKTRSGKTLRRTLRELLEHGVHGEFEKKVEFPATIEDANVVEEARKKVKEYFEHADAKGRHEALERRDGGGEKAKL